jgi:GNAT superfamily N-acetyltransferase
VAIVTRPLRPGEERLYLEIVNGAIRGVEDDYYTPEARAAWLVPITPDSLSHLVANPDGEVRFVAEFNREPVGIGALIVKRSELGACYVLPSASRRGVGSALVSEIERLAIARGLNHLSVSASLNAEPFYRALGYEVGERHEVVLRNGSRMLSVRMLNRL